MRRICVFTGSRADYGPLLPVIRGLADDAAIELRLLVSGSHLVPGQGNTADQIKNDGFRIDELVEMVVASDSPTGIAKSFALGVSGYAEALDRLDPDVLVVLGDRYEALAAAVASMFRLIPVAHIHGGDVTRGSIDDATRHAISKLSTIHFTATEDSRRRLVQMGEDPASVHLVGSPGIDTILSTRLLGRAELERVLAVTSGDPMMLVTYHSATADRQGSLDGIDNLLVALRAFPSVSVVFTGTNVDQGGRYIETAIRAFVRDVGGGRAVYHPSLGQDVYLSALAEADVVVGNSSSALIEAPVLGTPTVNIGSRQDGRVRGSSVIDCGVSAEEITSAVRAALAVDRATGGSPYGDGHAASRICRLLKELPVRGLGDKTFHALTD